MSRDRDRAPDVHAGAYRLDRHARGPSPGRALLARALARPERLGELLVLGEALGERPRARAPGPVRPDRGRARAARAAPERADTHDDGGAGPEDPE